MSEYYDHYHRWEPLAEFHFNIDSDDEYYDEDNYLYCLCSRAFIRDGVKTYYVEKEDASESDVEVFQDSHSQELDEHSHVHFSLDTSYKVKCEKDEGASCYCSASHTENCCSTDEHEVGQMHGITHALQPSDSGADLTYQDYHSDHDKQEKMGQDFQAIAENEDYLSENTWDKYWAVHGERLIWASWIKKYSDYINPAYLNDNNDLMMDDSGIPKQHSADEIFNETVNQRDNDDGIRERKFSYDSKVNPYGKTRVCVEKNEKNNETNVDEQWLPIGRRRSCSEHDRILSPKTIIGTDSMTNVTKLTFSSYDVTSSHVTSNSTPTDDYSVSSSSDDPSNDQTRIANVDDIIDQVPVEEMDTEEYWQFLWKNHFGEQYALHYANYIEKQNVQNNELPAINIESVPEQEPKQEKFDEKVLDIECENSEGNSQETPTIIEVQTQVEKITIEDKAKPRKRGKKTTNKYLGSVGVLLQNLLKEEQNKQEKDSTEITEAGEGHDKTGSEDVTVDTVSDNNAINVQQSVSSSNFISYSYDDGDDDPPEETQITLKRRHELDDEEIVSEKINSTFEIMGFCLHPEEMPKGQLVYRKRLARLRPPRYKRFGTSRKTYFDDEGNACAFDQAKDSPDEREIQTDHERAQITDKLHDAQTETLDPTDYDVKNNVEADCVEIDVAVEAASMPLPPDIEGTDVLGGDEKSEELVENTVIQQESTKRRRRQKRNTRAENEDTGTTDMPEELRDDPKMLKYWKKRHSLFHRFDEGIKLDRESWFSVTPENVARHIATKCTYDVVLDAFCGAGGNTIQFAKTSKRVIAIDIDPVKIEMAKHNASVYGVADQIEFMVGDFFELAPTLKADMVFLSPPWGGPKYSSNREYDLETMLEPRPASELISVARTISSAIELYLPRNSRPDQILALAKEVGGSVEVEQSYLDKRFVAITAYFY